MNFCVLILFSLTTPLNIPLKAVHTQTSSRRSLTQVPLSNEVNRLYVGSLTIGTTMFNVTFDTGSSDLWVFGSEGNCQTKCGGSDGCVTKTTCCTAAYMNTYKRTKSFKEDGKVFNIHYGRGWVSGISGIDNVTLSQINIRHRFGIATDWHPGLVDCFEKMDGILGLGFRNPSTQHTDNLISAMAKESLIESNIFSFYLKPGKETFILGNPVPEYYLELHYIDILRARRGWVVSVHGLGLSQKHGNITDILRSCYPSCSALLDSGTSYIILPISSYNKFSSAVFAVRDDCLSIDNIPDNGIACDAKIGLKDLPNFWLNMGGKQFIMTPEDYSIKECWEEEFFTGYIEQCSLTLSIAGSRTAGTSLYILGDVFMRKYYTVFDQTNKRIGLGSMKKLNDAVIILQEPSSKKSGNTLKILLSIFIPVGCMFFSLIFIFMYFHSTGSSNFSSTIVSLHVNQLTTVTPFVDDRKFIEDLESESV